MLVLSENAGRPGNENWLLIVTLAVSLALAAAAVNLWVARSFDTLKAFDAVDSFFHADPSTRRFIFAENIPDRIFVKHPNLGNFVNPPLRAIAKVLGGGDPAALRWELALWIVPIGAGIKTAAIFLTLWLLRLSALESVVIATLSAATFSHLLFTSMPESFGLTGTWLALLLLAGAWTLRHRDVSKVRDRLMSGVWLALGIVGVGITLTNLVPFVLVLLCVESLRQPSKVLLFRRVLVACVVALIGNAVLLGVFVGPKFDPQNQKDMLVGIRGFIHRKPHRRIVRFPAAVSNAFAPPAPTFLVKPESRTPFYFTFEKPGRTVTHRRWIPGVVWAALLAGAWGGLRASPQLRSISSAALTILIFNAGFHAWWGSEYILYSQHWQAGMVLLLAGLVQLSEAGKKWLLLALALSAIFLAFYNAGIVLEMLNTWATRGPGVSHP